MVHKGGRQKIVENTICQSTLWNHTKLLHLHTNMRLQSTNNEHSNHYCHWLLELGNGLLPLTDSGHIQLPSFLLLPSDTLMSLIQFVYGDIVGSSFDRSYFSVRAILAPRNEDIDAINDLALDMMPGETIEYLSADTIAPGDDHAQDYQYPVEFLNSLKLGGGFPPHVLRLRRGAPVMLLRNLDPRHGLCNGTRMLCTSFHRKVIEVEIITSTHKGDRVFIPRIGMTPSTLDLPFTMRRLQFSIRLAFGMTINKSQGQTLSIVGVHLHSPVFCHGQLYVALSRVSSPHKIKVFIGDSEERKAQRDYVLGRTLNIVFPEVLQMTNPASN